MQSEIFLRFKFIYVNFPYINSAKMTEISFSLTRMSKSELNM